MTSQQETKPKPLQKSVSETIFDWMKDTFLKLKNELSRHLFWWLIFVCLFFVWFFWSYWNNSFSPKIDIDYRDFGTTTHNIVARFFRGPYPQDTTLFMNLIMSIGSTATAASLILLWRDTEERKKYEKEQLEIQKLSYKPYLTPRSIHYFQALANKVSSIKFSLEEKLTLKIKLDSSRGSRDLKGVEFALYDVYYNDGICAIENIGKGMAGDIVVKFCKNERFEQGEVVEEKIDALSANKFIMIWKNKHYSLKGIDFDTKFYLKINYNSLWINENQNSDSHIFEAEPIEFEYERGEEEEKDGKKSKIKKKVKGYYLNFKKFDKIKDNL